MDEERKAKIDEDCDRISLEVSGPEQVAKNKAEAAELDARVARLRAAGYDFTGAGPSDVDMDD